MTANANENLTPMAQGMFDSPPAGPVLIVTPELNAPLDTVDPRRPIFFSVGVRFHEFAQNRM